jgi:hypothetical protein
VPRTAENSHIHRSHIRHGGCGRIKIRRLAGLLRSNAGFQCGARPRPQRNWRLRPGTCQTAGPALNHSHKRKARPHALDAQPR